MCPTYMCVPIVIPSCKDLILQVVENRSTRLALEALNTFIASERERRSTKRSTRS